MLKNISKVVIGLTLLLFVSNLPSYAQSDSVVIASETPTITEAVVITQTPISSVLPKQVQGQNVSGLATPTPTFTDWLRSNALDWIMYFFMKPLVTVIKMGQFVTVDLLDVRLPVVVDNGSGVSLGGYTSGGQPVFELAPSQPIAGKQIYEQLMMGGGRKPNFGGVNSIITSSVVGLRTPFVIYVFWFYFLNLANILILLILVLIGFAIMFQYNINAYHFRRILPRFLIAVIMVQYSWVICQFMFDINTMMGLSFYNISNKIEIKRAVFDKVDYSTTPPHVDFKYENTPVTLADVLTEGVRNVIQELVDQWQTSSGAAGATVTTGIWVFFGIVNGLPIIWSVCMGMLMGIVTFSFIAIVRWLMIYLLVIVSPIALLLYAIPEMHKSAIEWAKGLFLSLFMYPICMIMFSLLYAMAVTLK